MSTEIQNKRSRGAIFTGAVIVVIGVVWLLRKMNVFIPGWLISWQMFMIVLGLAIGVGNKFRNPASWILIGIGVVFLINDIWFIPYHIRDYFWPILVIAIGLIVLLKPKRKPAWKEEFGDANDPDDTSHSRGSTDWEVFGSGKGTFSREDAIDSVSIFNGLKRTVLSKHFKGGETVTIFGGTEINLIQADFDKGVQLEATVLFGGLKLIVPRNWEVRTEVTSILGGVEDKRYSAVEVVPEDKVFLITGTVIFGGIDVVSY